MVKVVVASKALYGGGTSFVSPTKIEQLRTACVRALRRAGDRGRARRSKELVLNLVAGRFNAEIGPAFVLLWIQTWCSFLRFASCARLCQRKCFGHGTAVVEL